MNCRTLLGTLGGASLVAAPLGAEAQPAGVPRIGVLAPTSCSHPNYQALRDGLRALGYVEGQTIIIECRDAAGRYERVAQHAAELVRLKVDVIVTDGISSARAAKQATKTIPVVMGAIGDPVGGGVVNSLARPGANITGLTRMTAEMNTKRLREHGGDPMMNRRAFVSGLAVAVGLPRVTAHAQSPPKTQRVGVLMTTNPVVAAHIVAVFTDSLKELGHVDGKNVVIEYRWAEGHRERLAEMAADLVRQKVDVIVASSQAPALAAKRATTTIPIVMINATDPVEAGLVASLARPGGNVTGLSQQLTSEIRAKQLQLLKETVPRVARVAVLRSPSTTVGLREYEAAGQALGMQIVFVEVKSRDDLASAFAAMVRDRVDALLAPGDTFLFTERQRVADLAREHRLPGIYSLREFTEVGGLMSYSARLTEQFRRAAVYVDKILRGARPATLPVESPSQYELAINLKTAKALGLTIPPALLVRADELIQ